jgi:hypothetical protein
MLKSTLTAVLLRILLLTAWLSPQLSRAQGVLWASGQSNATLAPSSSGATVVADAAGNTYLAGTGASLAGLGGLAPTAQGGTGGLFILKRDPAGQVQWLRRSGNGSPLALGLDGAGNVVVAGTFTGSTTIGSTALTSAGGTDAFVARISPAGSWLTAVRAGGSGNDVLNDLEVQPDGTTFVTGSFLQTAVFGPHSLTTFSGTGTSDTDAFVACLSPADNWQWAVSVGNWGPDTGQGVAADAVGHLTVTGTFRDTCVFGGMGIAARPQERGLPGGQDIFVAQLDAATGTWRWATRAGGINNDNGYDVAVDNSGTISLAGDFAATMDFGDSLALPTLTSRGAADIVVARLSAGGTWLWASSAGGTGGGGMGAFYGDKALTVAVDPAGTRTTVAGLISGTAYFGSTALSVNNIGALAGMFVAQAAGTDGHWLNATSLGTVGINQCRGLALSADGHVYLTGRSNRTVYFNDYRQAAPDSELPSHPGFPTNSSNFLVAARLDPNTGIWDQVLDVNQGGLFEVLATTHDAAGNTYVTGRFDGMLDIPTPTPTRLSSSAWQDAFIGKLDAAGHWLWIVQGTGPVSSRCEAGQAIAVDAAGRVTVTGYFEAASFSLGGQSVTGIFGSAGGLTIVNNLPGNNTFVAQLDGVTGATHWLRSLTAASNALALGLSLDPASGEASVVGTFRGTLRTTDGSPLTATATSAYDGFLARLDVHGSWRWITRAGGPGAGNGMSFNNTVFGSVEQDASGAYTIAGLVQGSSQLGTIALPGSPMAYQYYPFIARLDASGNTWQWAQSLAQYSRYEDGFYPARTDAAGNVYWPVSPGLRRYSAAGTLSWQLPLAAAAVAPTTSGDVTVLASTSTSPTTVGGLSLSGTGQYLTQLTATGTARWLGLLNGSSPSTTLDVVDAGGTLTAGGFGRSIRLAAGGTVPAAVVARLLPPPFITSFTPGAGNSGTVVVLSGTGFTDASAVAFNGTAAPGFVVSNGGTTITVTVPFGASTGPITVSSAGGTGSSATPFVILVGDLVISTPQDVQGTYNNVLVTGPATGGAGVGTLTGTLTVLSSLVVQDGGSLFTSPPGSPNTSFLFSCALITGTGSFTLEAGGTLGICDPAGITLSGPTGSVRVTGPRTFSDDAYYLYLGSTQSSPSHVTGNGLPGTVRELVVQLRRIINDPPPTFTLSQNLALRQALRLRSWTMFRGGHTLTLLSGPAGTALVETAGGRLDPGAGLSRMQRWIDPSLNPGLGYRHYASPMLSLPMSGLATAGFTPVFNQAYNSSATPGTLRPYPTVFGYDQSRLSSSPAMGGPAFDQGWRVPAATELLLPGQGVTANLPASALITFEGDFNLTAAVAATLGRGPQADAGWWLLGNPFPAPFDLSAPGAVSSSNVDAAVYVYESRSQYGGQFRSYVNGIGTGSPLIPAGQGFFVRSTMAGQPSSFSSNAAGRVTTFAAQPAFHRGATDPRPQLQLALRVGSQPATDDELSVYFEAGATAGVDAAFDAHKLLNPGLGSVYALATGGEPLAIAGLPELGWLPVTVSLGLVLPRGGGASLHATQLRHLASGTSVWLVDAATGRRQNLSQQPDYAFTAAAGTLNGRFALVFDPGARPTATTTASNDGLSLYPNPTHGSTTLILLASPHARLMELTDALGRVVRHYQLAAGTSQLSLDVRELPAGLYLLRCGTAASKLVVE